MNTISAVAPKVHAATNADFPESRLQAAWVRLRPGHRLSTVAGQAVTVISPGTWNVEAGPDFRAARIELDGHPLHGDVEIHCRAGDWIRHGHHHDRRYDHVILHVVGNDDTRDRRPPLPHPIIELAPVGARYPFSLARRFPAGDCRELFSADDDDTLRADFQAAGEERSRGKAAAMLQEMLARGAIHTLHHHLFDACGYKQNRVPFRELHSRFAAIAGDPATSPHASEHLLWGLSGLLPDPATATMPHPMADYVRQCWQTWWKVRGDAQAPLPWQRHGLRPLNRPERRIAAAAMLLSKLGTQPLARLVAIVGDHSLTPARRVAALLELLVCRHPLWDQHLGFTEPAPQPAAVLGRARAIDLAANVVVPALLAHAEIQPQPALTAAANSIFRQLPSPQENRVLAIAAHRWFMPPDRARYIFAGAAAAQGGIHLYRHFCELRAGNCRDCPVAHHRQLRITTMTNNPPEQHQTAVDG